MRWKRRRFSKPKLFAILMAASLVCLMIPGRFTRPAKNPLQLLAAMQWAVHDTASRAGESLRAGMQTPVPPEEFHRVAKERDDLASQVVRQDGELASLRQNLAAVTGWRERGLPSSTRLVPARIVSADAIAWRESLQIDRGSSDGVDVGDWVVSHEPPPAAGSNANPDPNVDTLLGECVLGQIAEVAPLTSRLILLSDAYLRPWARVRIARVAEGRLIGPDAHFVLQGVGQGQMTVRDVPAPLCGGAGGIGVGDLVISARGDPRLPISMIIGRIRRIDPHAKNPQLCVLSVASQSDTRSLRQVYVISTKPREE